MPIREYRCQKCGHKFETLILAGENENDLTCPKCHAAQVKRCMSVFTGMVPVDGTGAAKSAAAASSCGSCSGGSCSTCH